LQFNIYLGTISMVKAALAPEVQMLRGNNVRTKVDAGCPPPPPPLQGHMHSLPGYFGEGVRRVNLSGLPLVVFRSSSCVCVCVCRWICTATSA
jgi:hypothetical protein